ncbi:hypothetical protein D3C74_367270 [compost metagenome]
MVAAVLNVKVDVAAQKQVQLIGFMPVIECPHVISSNPVQVEKVFMDGIITKFKRIVHLVPPGQFAQ